MLQQEPVRTRLTLRADLVHRNGLSLIIAGVLALVSTAATLAVPLLVKQLVEDLGADGHPVSTVLVIAGAAVLGAIASAVSGFLLMRIGEAMILRLRTRVMEHCLRLPLRDVGREGPGNLVARITSDAVVLRNVVDVGVVMLPMAAVTTVLTLALMVYLDWVLSLVTVIAFAIAGAVIAMVLRKMKAGIGQQQTALGELAQRFTAMLGSLPTIKACRGEAQAVERLADEAGNLNRTTVSAARLQSMVSPILSLGQQIALVSVILGGGLRMSDGSLTVGDFAAFLLLLLQLVAPVTIVATGVGRLQAGLAARERFEQLLDIPVEPAGPAVGVGAPCPDGPLDVRFENVSFGYDGVPVLAGVDFTASGVGLTALVGHSGAGKSTAVGLLERFGDVDGGRILLGGRDIRQWPLHQLRGALAYVDQYFTLVEGSIRENLLLGRSSEVTDAELAAVLEKVGLATDIKDLGDGDATVLGRGNDLSGGQRQRLALARMLLSDAPVVLLDEPSSQMDGLNEQRFRAVIDEVAAERAVIMVAHRLSTVQHADHVVVLEHGSVTDAGRHEELMDRCESYAALVRSQQWGLAATPA